jgi:hypothetical protein
MKMLRFGILMIALSVIAAPVLADRLSGVLIDYQLWPAHL